MTTTPIEIRVKECETCRAEYVQHPDTHASTTTSTSPIILGGFCSKYCERQWFEEERALEWFNDMRYDGREAL